MHSVGTTRLRLVVLLLGAGSLLVAGACRADGVTCAHGAAMNIVAHEDDDLLFMNPDVLHDIQQERCVRTVFVTAGDAGKGSAYWRQRAVGAQAAYARMAQTPSAWTHSDAGVDGHRIEVYTLQGHPP